METVSQLKGRGQEIIQGSQKQGKYHIGFGTETPQSFRDFFFSPRFFSSISAVLLPHPPPYFLFPLFAFLLLKHLYKILTFTTRGDFQLETANCRFFFSFPLFAFLLSQRQQLTLTSCFTAWATSSCFISYCQISTNYLNSHAYHHCSVQL